MKILMKMQSLGVEPRHCKCGGIFKSGETMNATSNGWYCTACTETSNPKPKRKHPKAKQKKNKEK